MATGHQRNNQISVSVTVRAQAFPMIGTAKSLHAGWSQNRSLMQIWQNCAGFAALGNWV